MKSYSALSHAYQTTWDDFLSATHKLLIHLESKLELKCNMCIAEYEILKHLAESPTKTLHMAKLAGYARLSPSSLTRRFDLMVTRGWVERHHSNEDCRVVLGIATKAGIAQARKAAPTYRRVQDEVFFNQLSQIQLTTLQAISKSIALASFPPGSAHRHS